MPIYEYTCEGCGGDFEMLVNSGKARPACPECGSKRLQRRFSTFAAHQGGAKASPCASGQCPAQSAAPMGSACGGGSKGCPFS